MAEVVVKLDSILLQERESAEAGVDEGIFISRVRYIWSRIAGRRLTQAVERKETKGLRPFTFAELERATNYFSEKDHSTTVGGTIYKGWVELKGLRPFTFAELERATNYFSEKDHSTTVGGTIYKGWVDKRTYAPTESGIGLRMYLNLKAEEYNHPNLVKLLGYCLNEKELLCVYEHIPDPSLDKLLFGDPSGTSLSFLARLKIAVGVAHGLSFAHQRRHVAYTQFKTNCILVDMDYNARLWDFEVENSFLDHGSYSFKKDAPYAAPEWFRYQADVIFDGILGSTYCYHSGVKSEVYAFGVVLLELLTGMKAYDDKRPEGKTNLVKWSIPLLTDKEDFGNIIDPQLQHESFLPKGAYKLASLVSNCLHPSQEKRLSMEEIYQDPEDGPTHPNIIRKMKGFAP
ncbi:kinase RLK-Pelle-CrRLK1L-1 family protein, partial [Tanacetum coccineum]